MKKAFHILLIVLELLLCALFLFPVTVGIVNLGNITGAAVCILLLAYTLWFRQLNRLIQRAWAHRLGRLCTAALGAALALTALLAVILSVMMICANVSPPAENATAVILGCGVYGERPSLMLQERMDAAYRYLLQNPDSACLLSGGMGEGETISEAECMYRYLTAKGISPERLYQEDRSTSTRENLRFSHAIIVEQGLNPNIAIVTNEFHECRAGLIAKKLGLSHSAVPARTTGWLFPSYYVRELYGILYELVFR